MSTINNGNNDYSQSYLNAINDVFKRMDSKDNGGNGDGKINTQEALNDLNIAGLLSGLDENSKEYKKLKSLTDKIPETLSKYAGDDNIFDEKEWADFLNGKEWGEVLETYHSSSNFSKLEMEWIDESHNNQDGMCTKGEVKAGILNNMQKIDPNVDCSFIEKLIDKYAGKDGTFTVKEYTRLKNNPVYKAFINKYHVSPF